MTSNKLELPESGAGKPNDLSLAEARQAGPTQLSEVMQCPYAAPPEEDPMPLTRKQRVTIGIVLAVVALIVAIPLAAWASSPDTYAGIIQTLDAKKDNVTALTATTAGASTAITMIPGDIGTPIAEQIASLSSDLLFILSILYLEKFLLTTLGLVALRFIIPLGLLLWIGALVAEYRPGLKNGLFKIGLKMVAFGVAMALLIPASVWVSDSIDRTFQESIDASNAAALTATEQLQETMKLEGEEASGGGDGGNGGFFQGIANAVQGAVSSIGTNVEQITDDLHNALGTLIDTIAIMIVTSCLVPIVMLLLFLWVVRAITGIDVQLPVLAARNRLRGAGRSAVRKIAPKH